MFLNCLFKIFSCILDYVKFSSKFRNKTEKKSEIIVNNLIIEFSGVLHLFTVIYYKFLKGSYTKFYQRNSRIKYCFCSGYSKTFKATLNYFAAKKTFRKL